MPRSSSRIDPIGYTLLVLRPVLMFAGLAFVALLQHAAGIAMAAALYVLMLRHGMTRWLAALAVTPVLLDAYQLNAEQTIMPDVLFEALLVAGIVLLPWQPRPVGFRNSATGPGLGFYAARLYSLMRPPRRGWRWIRLRERSVTGWSGRGGRRWRLR